MKSKIKLSYLRILVSIVVFLTIIYLSPKIIKENSLFSDFLNIRTFTNVYAIDISDCSDLNQAGSTYYLTADILNSATYPCMSISANNITLDCQGHAIDGNDVAWFGIYIDRTSLQTTNITVKNCIVSDWNLENIYLNNANGNNLTNITSNSSPGYGFYLGESNFNIISNSTANSNNYGVFLTSYSSNNTISNSTANSNNYGFYFGSNCNNNTITNSNASFNAYGFYLSYSYFHITSNIISTSNAYGFYISNSNATIFNSKIENNTNYGIYSNNARLSKIYNNLFNNTNNTYFAGTVYANIWNTTKQSGTRIYSSGNQIGGNYWTNSTNNGYSDTCTDADGDDFCDSAYNVTTGTSCTPGVNCGINVDFLPLSDRYLQRLTYSLNSTNSTLAGTAILHSLNWTDNSGLSGYIFQFCNGTWNGTDCVNTWVNGTFTKCQNITISNAGSSTLTNFPAYINLSYDADMLSNYQDLRFYSSSCNNGGSILDYEIDNYTASNAHIWVRIPSLPTTGTIISVYYKNASAVESGQNATGVWNSNFMAVYHLTGATYTDIDDSTSNGNNVTSEDGSPAFNQAGKIPNAVDFERGTLDGLSVPDASNLDGFTQATWESWIKPESLPTDGALYYYFNKYNATGNQRGWTLMLYNTTGAQQVRLLLSVDGTSYSIHAKNTTLTTGVWYHILWTWTSGSSPQLYINGVNQTLGSVSVVTGTIFANTAPLFIGKGFDSGDGTNRSFDGLVDEARVSNVSRSADWINQTYQMVQNQNSFVSFGSEETYSTGWVNDTWVSFSGATWSNVTKVVNSTVGANIAWKIYANDTSNNWNVSDTYSYVTTSVESQISTDYFEVVVNTGNIQDSNDWNTNFTIAQGNNYILTVDYDGNQQNITIGTKVNKSVYVGFFDVTLTSSETSYKDKFQKSYTLP